MIMEYLSDAFTWAVTGGNAAQNARVVSTHAQPVKWGKIVGLEYIIGDATNAITMTFNLYDPHGVLIHTRAAIARNATTVESMDYVVATADGTIPIFGPGCIVEFDPSADSGLVAITGQVRIYYED